MPVYEVTSPDGRKFRVEGPEGSTAEQAMQQVQSQQRTPVNRGASGTWDAPLPRGTTTDAQTEPLAAMGTGMLAMPIAGLAGIAQGAKNLVSPGMPAADRISQVQSALTYQPRTQMGQKGLEMASAPLELWSKGTDYWGGAAADATGSPAIGAGVKTALDFGPALLTRGKMGNGSRSTDPVRSPVAAGEVESSASTAAKGGRKPGLAGVSEKPPAIEELQAAKNAAYKAAEESGVVVGRDAINRLKVGLVDDMNAERINAKLHPKAAAAMEEILKTKGQQSLGDLETLRRIAKDAADSLDKADARLGAKMIERIDDFEATLADADVVAGNAAGGTAFKEARALNTRLSKARTIQKLFDDAELAVGANYTAAGMDTALRQQFRALAKNERKLRGFTAEERAAIRKVVMGGPTQNALRLLGKFAPNGVVSSLASLGMFGLAGPGGLVLPAAGIVARQGSAKMGLKNAQTASELVRRGPQTALNEKQLKQLLDQQAP